MALSTQDISSMVPLERIRPEDLIRLYNKTVTAILVITGTYVSGAAALILLLLLKVECFYLAFAFPLLGYLWLISFGAKFTNHRYGFKKTLQGPMIFVKKKHHYSTLAAIHAVIFLITAIVRLITEIINLRFLGRELKRREELNLRNPSNRARRWENSGI